MTNPKTSNPLSGRTKIITAVSIGAVGLASVFAIGANLGILSGADGGEVGTVSAGGDLVPADTQVVDVYLDEQGNPLASDATAPTGSRRFTVDSAGTVDVSANGDTPRIDLITPASGWTVTPATTTGTEASVTFTNGTRTLDFTATVSPDGTVSGDVTESTTAASTPQPSEDDDHEDDDHEDDDHEDDEYEGRDFDD